MGQYRGVGLRCSWKGACMAGSAGRRRQASPSAPSAGRIFPLLLCMCCSVKPCSRCKITTIDQVSELFI